MGMRAIVKEKAASGAVLLTKEIPAPADGEVLVRVRMASICGTDLHIYAWDPWAQGASIKVPGVMGHECVAEVVQLGSGVQSVAVGDRVSIETHIPCGHCRLCLGGRQHICENLRLFGLHTDGCFAEWAVVPEVCLRKVPGRIPDQIAAVLEPLGVGVHAAEVSQVKGKRVAVLGAGPIGLFSAMASAALGAASVSISDVKSSRLSVASACGDFHLWNPVETAASNMLGGSHAPDVIIETTGNERAIQEALPYLRKGGEVVMAGLFRAEVPLLLSRDLVFKEAVFRGIHGRRMWSTWDLMEQLILEQGMNVAPAITHHLGLEDFEEGIRLASTGEGMKIVMQP